VLACTSPQCPATCVQAVPPRPALTPRRILLVYLVVAAAWIGFSDLAVAALFPGAHELAVAQTLKGWAFIAATGLLLGLLLRRYELERERHTTALSERERTFRLLAEHARDVVFRYRVGPPPAVEYVSPSIEAALGYSPARLYREPGLLASLMDPDDASAFPMSPVDASAGDLAIVRLRTSEGQWVPFEIHRGRQPDGTDGDGVIEGVARDVTERLSSLVRAHASSTVSLLTLYATNRRRSAPRRSPPSWVLDLERSSTGGIPFRLVRPPGPGRPNVERLATWARGGIPFCRPVHTGDPARARGPEAPRSARTARGEPDIARDEMMAPWRTKPCARLRLDGGPAPAVEGWGRIGSLAIYGAECRRSGRGGGALEEPGATRVGIGELRARALHRRPRGAPAVAAAVGQSGESVVNTEPEHRSST